VSGLAVNIGEGVGAKRFFYSIDKPVILASAVNPLKKIEPEPPNWRGLRAGALSRVAKILTLYTAHDS